MGDEMSGMARIGGDEGIRPSAEDPVGKRLTGECLWCLSGVSANISAAPAYSCCTCSTNCVVLLASERVYRIPDSMLNDYSSRSLSGLVFFNTLLQCVDFVGVGERWRRVLEEFEFRIKKRRIKRGRYSG